MPRIIETTVYKFNELSDKAKQAAIDGLRDLNVDHDWWDAVYEDAAQVGLKITGFDEYHVDAEFNHSAENCASSIIETHGKDCATYLTAIVHLDSRSALLDRENIIGAVDELDDELQELDDDFLTDISSDYSISLSSEYDYLTEDNAIEEAIIANDFEFTEGGNRI